MSNTEIQEGMKSEMIKNLHTIEELIPDFIQLLMDAEEDDNVEFFIIEGVKVRELKIHIEKFLQKR